MIYNRRGIRDSLIEYAEEYGAVSNYEELVPQSMLVQARLDSYVIGHLRSDWPRKTGITYWELKDVWPAVSTGSIDYYGVPKTLYYFAKRAYAPVAVFSSSPQIVSARLDLSARTFSPSATGRISTVYAVWRRSTIPTETTGRKNRFPPPPRPTLR